MILTCRGPITPNGFCYIETHDHDTYTGHFRLRLIEFTPTRLAFEIARPVHNFVEVTYDLHAERFRIFENRRLGS